MNPEDPRSSMESLLREAETIERLSSSGEEALPGLASLKDRIHEILDLEGRLQEKQHAVHAEHKLLDERKHELIDRIQQLEAELDGLHKAWDRERESWVKRLEEFEASGPAPEVLKEKQTLEEALLNAREELGRRQARLDTFEAERAALHARIEELQSRFESLKAEHERALEDANRERASLEAALRAAQLELGNSRPDIQSLKQDRAVLAAELGELRAKVPLLESDWEKIKASTHMQLVKERERYEAERQAWEEEHQKLDQALDNAHSGWKRDRLELEAKIENYRAAWNAERRKLEAKLQEALSWERASREEHETAQRLEADNRRMAEELRRAPDDSGESAGEGTDFMPPIPEAGLSGPLPSMEAPLEPAWAKVVEALRRPVGSAFSHLRRLAAARIPKGLRALARMAAGELLQVQDQLKMLGRLHEEDALPAEPGRLERAIESVLAAWEPTLRRRKIQVLRKLSPALPAVVFHQDSLRIALYQILRNAYEAMPRGGMLTAAASADKETGGVKASFTDTGVGFSEQALDSLFVPFASTKPGHLGLGLALVRRTMDNLGGEAQAANGPRGGAVVSVHFFPPDGESLPPLGEDQPPI